jgi:hypothetical protein
MTALVINVKNVVQKMSTIGRINQMPFASIFL